MTSPGGAYAAATFCFAVSGIMSMTFFRNDWGDRGTVMIGLMALAAIGGVLLVMRGRRLARVRSLFEALGVACDQERLVAGEPAEFLVTLTPARTLELERVVVRLEARERATPEGEPMNAAVHTLFQVEAVEELGKTLEPGSSHEVRVKLEVPSDAPGTFQTRFHSLGCDLTLDVEGKGFSPVLESWPVEVEAGPARVSEAGIFGSRFEFEGLALTLEGADLVPPGGPMDAELVLVSEEGMDHGGIDATLSWVVEGEGIERTEIAQVEVAPAGNLPAGETRLPVRLEVPRDVPATYHGEILAVRWVLEVALGGLAEGEAAPVLGLRVGRAGAA
jgi:hypothetical protein